MGITIRTGHVIESSIASRMVPCVNEGLHVRLYNIDIDNLNTYLQYFVCACIMQVTQVCTTVCTISRKYSKKDEAKQHSLHNSLKPTSQQTSFES